MTILSTSLLFVGTEHYNVNVSLFHKKFRHKMWFLKIFIFSLKI